MADDDVREFTDEDEARIRISRAAWVERGTVLRLLTAFDHARARIAELLESEHALSRSYVRVREILKDFGSLDTPHAPAREVVWQITEDAARKAVARIAELEAAVADARRDEDAARDDTKHWIATLSTERDTATVEARALRSALSECLALAGAAKSYRAIAYAAAEALKPLPSAHGAAMERLVRAAEVVRDDGPLKQVAGWYPSLVELRDALAALK